MLLPLETSVNSKVLLSSGSILVLLVLLVVFIGFPSSLAFLSQFDILFWQAKTMPVFYCGLQYPGIISISAPPLQIAPSGHGLHAVSFTETEYYDPGQL